jgi:hypothetical protein
MFFKGSRYERVETTSLVDEQGREVRYKKVRFLPDPAPRFGYAVEAGDRLDNIAFEVFRDPERFWRICDANATVWPPELTERAGRVIGIPGPED